MTTQLDAYPTIKAAVVSANVIGLKPNQKVSVNIGELRDLIFRHVAEITKLRTALGFAASVIKSGEDWTDTCEREIGGVLRSPRHEEFV